jgi:hypothetical protein
VECRAALVVWFEVVRNPTISNAVMLSGKWLISCIDGRLKRWCCEHVQRHEFSVSRQNRVKCTQGCWCGIYCSGRGDYFRNEEEIFIVNFCTFMYEGCSESNAPHFFLGKYLFRMYEIHTLPEDGSR